MVLKPEYSSRLLTALLPLVLIVGSCEATHSTRDCPQTQQAFMAFFNSGEYHKVSSLFKENSKTKTQFQKLAQDLEYMREVAGKILSMEVTAAEGNKVQYKSTLEATALDISFIYNAQCQLTSLLIKNHFPEDLPLLERNSTSMALPFHGEWYVFWGGPTIAQNYHNAHQNMRGAFDFVMRDQRGKSYSIDGQKNEDYYAFGQEIIAPCDAKVVRVIRGIKDNVWPKMNTIKAHGNTVILKTKRKEFLFFAHLKEKSIVVNEGDLVVQGQKLGLCGNSGYSTEPHLHFNLQNVADLFDPTGAPCYFDNILVDGQLRQDYTPVRGERIQNQKQ